MGKGDIAGTRILVNSSTDAQGNQTVVKSVVGKNNTPVSAAESFNVTLVKRSVGGLTYTLDSGLMFAGGGSYGGELKVATAPHRASSLHLESSHFNEMTGHSEHSARDYSLVCNVNITK
jgi:hypothetical protein